MSRYIRHVSKRTWLEFARFTCAMFPRNIVRGGIPFHMSMIISYFRFHHTIKRSGCQENRTSPGIWGNTHLRALARRWYTISELLNCTISHNFASYEHKMFTDALVHIYEHKMFRVRKRAQRVGNNEMIFVD